MRIATNYIRGDSRKLTYLQRGHPQVGKIEDLVKRFRSNDLIVVNDSATAPMSVSATDRRGRKLELRLLKAESGSRIFHAVGYEGGSWKVPTEARTIVDFALSGGSLFIGSHEFSIESIDGAICRLRAVEAHSDFLKELFSSGNMIQYSYMEKEIPLWAAQTVFASRPWSSEAPSAAFAFSWHMIFSLIATGVRFTSITHGAGLSSIGNTELDRILPLPEVSHVGAETLRLIRETRKNGGRVIAVGTSVVRAVEAASRLAQGNKLSKLPFENSLHISAGFQIESFDGILTGMHQEGESHFELLNAFTSASKIEELLKVADRFGCLTHEFGDFMLLMRED